MSREKDIKAVNTLYKSLNEELMNVYDAWDKDEMYFADVEMYESVLNEGLQAASLARSFARDELKLDETQKSMLKWLQDYQLKEDDFPLLSLTDLGNDYYNQALPINIWETLHFMDEVKQAEVLKAFADWELDRVRCESNE